MRSSSMTGAQYYSDAIGSTIPEGLPGSSTASARYLIFIRYTYYAFIFSVPFDAIAMKYMEGASFTLSRLIGYFLVLSTFAQPRTCYTRFPRAVPYFALYLGVYLVLAVSQAPSLSAVLGPAATLVQMMILFWISFSLMLSDRVVAGTLWSLAISCTTVGVLQAMGLTSDVLDQDRISAAGENPNTLAAVLSLGLLALGGLAFGRMKTNRAGRLLFDACGAVLLMQIVRTGSRGALVALVLALMGFTLRKDRGLISKLKLAAMVALVLGGLLIISLQFEAVRVRWVNTFTRGDLAGRDRIYPEALGMFLERPMTGWGPVNHVQELGRRLGLPERDPHNLYLWILNEVGIVGAIPFFLGLWWCWRCAWNARLGLQGILPATILIFMLVINLKGTYHNQKIFWVTLAYVSASGVFPHVVARARLRVTPRGFRRVLQRSANRRARIAYRGRQI
jgi:O-antigen ligase